MLRQLATRKRISLRPERHQYRRSDDEQEALCDGGLVAEVHDVRRAEHSRRERIHADGRLVVQVVTHAVEPPLHVNQEAGREPPDRKRQCSPREAVTREKRP